MRSSVSRVMTLVLGSALMASTFGCGDGKAPAKKATDEQKAQDEQKQQAPPGKPGEERR